MIWEPGLRKYEVTFAFLFFCGINYRKSHNDFSSHENLKMESLRRTGKRSRMLTGGGGGREREGKRFTHIHGCRFLRQRFFCYWGMMNRLPP